MFLLDFSVIGRAMSNWSTLDKRLARKQKLMKMVRMSACMVQRFQGQTRTVPAKKLCMAANWVPDARCVSWPFIAPACTTQQPAQAVHV